MCSMSSSSKSAENGASIRKWLEDIQCEEVHVYGTLIPRRLGTMLYACSSVYVVDCIGRPV